ncbi:MAG: polyhydroxyalkanoic acid system family protein [Pirellulaceae bacterium]|nr:polyhydroxyalkanoic acid system family protein [Planctomycetales bacterium]MCA9208332.1 polyhydroxyalkanoic acid system family protein [Planctomycetales bacterium]MCA9219684.1 polyhydroxyalkanoic acid system family protein [Planctomycetales bacterium]MCA9228419.1 polyhydroxyalkanoic acid system family protein [Planctomycetales bacterium]
MPGFSTQVPHNLGRESATERLKGFVQIIQQRYQDQVKDLQGEWNDNVLDVSFSTYGFKIKANVVVEDDSVKLNGELPFTAMAFRGKIEQSIKGELEKALA